jgi:sucrose synthase
MSKFIQAVLTSDEKVDLRQFLGQLRTQQERYFLRNQILHEFATYCAEHDKPPYFQRTSLLGELLVYTHELFLEEESIWLILRPKIASQEIYRLAGDLSGWETMPVRELLALRDRWVNRYSPNLLEIDLAPFYQDAPTIRDPRNIGNGLEFLNRYLSSKLFAAPDLWLEALWQGLRQKSYNNTPLLLNERIYSTEQLSEQVKQALKLVGQFPEDTPYEKFRFELQDLGFEPGWGSNASRVRDTLELFDRSINSPDHAVLEAFLAHISLIFRVVLVSVHGWFGQEGVLGRPETAGQAVYVLDQARSLDKQLQENIKLAGLDVFGIEPKVIVLTRLIPNCEGSRCDQPLEKIQGTNNAWILRVPFREFNPKVTQNWISRFEIWPYLETFAEDAEKELLSELGGHPDLIIGNYSDGNLVTFLLAKRLKAIQCHIAHALEKPKYLFSNLYWQDLEAQYHFSLQFTADLITMNAADFILASTYQEIVGTPESIGYYESYKHFSMPRLYHVVDGIELFNPKFNVVPPGVNEEIFFSYTETSSRIAEDRERIKQLLFEREEPNIIGYLEEPSKRPIFAFAPLLPSKNLSSLVECFAIDSELQQLCNLILLTTQVQISETTNAEQQGEIDKIKQLIEQYHLQGKIRWLGMRLATPDIAEAYRAIADLGGIFVHPARFEAFGLIVLEAMSSGVPTFATCFGGPLEIIQDGENGFLINPTDLPETATKIKQFIWECEENPDYWQKISQRGIKRVRDKYNWRSHTKQLLLLAKIYRFWKTSTEGNKGALLRYLEALYYLIYKPRAEQLLEEHMQR